MDGLTDKWASGKTTAAHGWQPRRLITWTKKRIVSTWFCGWGLWGGAGGRGTAWGWSATPSVRGSFGWCTPSLTCWTWKTGDRSMVRVNRLGLVLPRGMRSSIIEYSPTTTTLDVHFIASRAAPANSNSSDHSQHVACVSIISTTTSSSSRSQNC